MRIVLVGAVGSTRTAFEAMVQAECLPVAVMTLPLAKSVRHSNFVDLRQLAEQHEVPLVETADINSQATISKLRALNPDYVMVIGWSQICHAEFLSVPRLGAIGYHPALLPKNRGRAVIPWTILQRAEETGSTLFWLDAGTDSGHILSQERIPVVPDETATTLMEKVLGCLGPQVQSVLPLLLGGTPPRIPQDSAQATYCAKRTPEDGLINWAASADDVWTLIRAVTQPYPGAFTYYQGKKLVIWEADYLGEAPFWGVPGQVQAFSAAGVVVQCGDRKHVVLKTVQIEGESPIAASSLLKMHAKMGGSSLA